MASLDFAHQCALRTRTQAGVYFPSHDALDSVADSDFCRTGITGETVEYSHFGLAGVEERVTYRLESTVWGSQISCSVMLRGWLAPLIWSLIRDSAAGLAARLAVAAEEDPPLLSPPLIPA